MLMINFTWKSFWFEKSAQNFIEKYNLNFVLEAEVREDLHSVYSV